MPIARSFMCQDCGHHLEVILSASEWDSPAPDCPECARRQMAQEFKPVAIGGSHVGRAAALVEDIMRNDYQVADYKSDGRAGGRGKVRYRDQTEAPTPHQVAAAQAAAAGVLNTAISLGRETRLRHGGNGLDMLHRALRSGDQPDLIEMSKRRSMKVY